MSESDGVEVAQLSVYPLQFRLSLREQPVIRVGSECPAIARTTVIAIVMVVSSFTGRAYDETAHAHSVVDVAGAVAAGSVGVSVG